MTDPKRPRGRPSKWGEPTRAVTIRLPESDVDRLDRLDGNRTEAVRLLLDSWDERQDEREG